MTTPDRQWEDADELADWAVENASFLASLDHLAELPPLPLSTFPTQTAGQERLTSA